MPKISVIIPTHNRKKLLEKAAASVLEQSYQDFELLIVDDGSTDGSESLAFEDARVRILKQNNRGVSAARNMGLQHAQGKWIAFLDSDDLWLPQKLESQMAFHKNHPQLAISQTDEIWIRNGVRVNSGKRHQKPEGEIFIPSLELCLVSPSSVIFKKEILEVTGTFDETLPACEDYDLWLRIALLYPFGLLKEALMIKTGGHSDQLSQRFWGMDRFRIRSLTKILETAPLSTEQKDACLRVLQNKCKIIAQGCQKRGRHEEAKDYLSLTQKFTRQSHAIL